MNEFKIKQGLIVQGGLSASFAYTTASVALSAQSASQAQVANFAPGTMATGSTYPITSSWANNVITASFSTTAATASFFNGNVQSAQLATSASFASSSVSQSIATSNVNSTFYLEFTPSTGSANGSWVTTSLAVNPSVGSLQATSFTSSLTGIGLLGTASFANSASYSLTASLANTASNVVGLNLISTGSLGLTIGGFSVIGSWPTGSFLAAFFDYAAMSASANSRAGTVFGSWVNGAVTFSEYCNVDVGNTNDLTMSLGISASTVQFSASVQASSQWTIRVLGRFI